MDSAGNEGGGSQQAGGIPDSGLDAMIADYVVPGDEPAPPPVEPSAEGAAVPEGTSAAAASGDGDPATQDGQSGDAFVVAQEVGLEARKWRNSSYLRRERPCAPSE